MGSEMASISFSGPARVTLFGLDTEYTYDYLQIGSQRFTGHYAEVQHIDLPEGISTILWYSDFSVNGAGWEFEVAQKGGTAEFHVDNTVAPGDELIVGASHKESENINSVSTAITDCKDILSLSRPRLRGAAGAFSHAQDVLPIAELPTQPFNLHFAPKDIGRNSTTK